MPEDQQAQQGQQEHQATFTPPATQADLDRIIADRLSRERAKYADYSDLQKKAKAFDEAQEAAKTEQQKLADRAAAAEAKVAEYEARAKLANFAKEIVKDSKVPADALRGTTEDEIRAHFEQLKALIPADSEKEDDGKPYVPYRELSKSKADAPEPTPGMGTLRAAYAEASQSK